ncbi:MAG: AAA family ATPase [Deltaproteobacteria bacterium]|nr:AAA family ATPase [Deltaproteobacteria bacterium]
MKREIVKYFQSFISSTEEGKPVLLVEGARQTGKTTAVQMAIQALPHLYIDLEKEKVFRSQIDACREFKDWEALLADTYQFKPGQGKILVIDEAQESSHLGSFVRYMKEDWKNQTTILLGSLMSRLFRDGVREPVGRVERFTVYPFSFKEFLIAHEKQSLVEAIETWEPNNPFSVNRHAMLIDYLQQYLETGGLPEVVQKHHEGKDWRHTLLQLKIQYEEDFTRVFGVEKLSLFQRILKRTAECVGSPSKKTTIVASSEQGYQTLADMLSQLERWSLIHRVPQESYEPTRSGRIIPKRYLFDTGICQLLGGGSRPSVELLSHSSDSMVRDPLGGLLENFVLCELYTLRPESVHGWRHKTNGSEIDFIFKKEGKTIPVEVKSALRFRRDFLAPLKNYLHLYNLEKGFLVDLTPGGMYQEGSQIIFQIPLYCVSEIHRLGIATS